jgi:hypothetical protein
MPKIDFVYPAIPVTRVLTATVGPVTVVTKLYGAVSPARLDKEQKEVQYRAFQLSPLPPRVRRERTVVVHDEQDRWVMEPAMSGGRR